MGKTYLFIVALCCVFFSEAQTYDYQVITSVESIIPSGAGRSRLISTEETRNYQDFTSQRTDGKKVKDMSATSVITYKIQEFNPTMNPILDGKKQVLFGFTSHGWLTQTGIDFNKITWYLIDDAEWMHMMVAYVKVASEEKNETTLKEILTAGKVVNKGVKLKSKLVIPFFKLTGDMYVVTDYSKDMKLLYNERSLGIFLKETRDLVQIGRGDIIDIHEFLFDND